VRVGPPGVKRALSRSSSVNRCRWAPDCCSLPDGAGDATRGLAERAGLAERTPKGSLLRPAMLGIVAPESGFVAHDVLLVPGLVAPSGEAAPSGLVSSMDEVRR
jgi:hypothetical protein